MQIPFLDLKAGYLEVQADIDSSIKELLKSGWYILGKDVASFEEEYAEYCEAKYCVGVGNGLDALHLSLLSLGIGAGDEVIVPSNTYIATWLAVSQCGATPVPVEPDPNTYNIDPTRIKAAITNKTKAILPVHLYGQPADLGAIMQVAREHGLRVLEDGAQAHGSRYRGQKIGSHGDIVAWSFYPGKNLGCFGDGGAVTTNNIELARQIRTLGNYGSSIKYVNKVQGFNSRLDPIQAVSLKVKLKVLDDWNQRRVQIAKRYQEALGGIGITLPASIDRVDPVWHLYVIQHPDRNLLQQRLKKDGIDTMIHYPIPPHLQDAYKNLGFSIGSFPLAEKIHRQVLSLPIFPQMTSHQVDYVIESVIRNA